MGYGSLAPYPEGSCRGLRPEHDDAARRLEHRLNLFVPLGTGTNLPVPEHRPRSLAELGRQGPSDFSVLSCIADEDVRHDSLGAEGVRQVHAAASGPAHQPTDSDDVTQLPPAPWRSESLGAAEAGTSRRGALNVRVMTMAVSVGVEILGPVR